LLLGGGARRQHDAQLRRDQPDADVGVLGGLLLGVIESFTSYWFGPERSVTISFALLLVLLFVRPSGVMGRRGYE
jgi:branched-subunit amino acid ABC-type transport system permease component